MSREEETNHLKGEFRDVASQANAFCDGVIGPVRRERLGIIIIRDERHAELPLRDFE